MFFLKQQHPYEAVQAQLGSMKSKTTNVNQILDSRENKRNHKGKKKTKHVIDATTQDILKAILNTLRKEKLARNVVALIILLGNAELRQANQKPI